MNLALYAHGALECPSVSPRLLDKGVRDVQLMPGNEFLQKSSPASGVKHRVEVASNRDLQVRAALLRESRSKLIVGGFQKLVGVAGMWHIYGYRSKFPASEVEVERRNPVTMPAQLVSWMYVLCVQQDRHSSCGVVAQHCVQDMPAIQNPDLLLSPGFRKQYHVPCLSV